MQSRVRSVAPQLPVIEHIMKQVFAATDDDAAESRSKDE